MSENSPETSVSFEQSMDELENIVNKMEQGDLPLDEALTLFERGVTLAKTSQQALDSAEQRVKILMQNQQGEQLSDLDASNEDNG